MKHIGQKLFFAPSGSQNYEEMKAGIIIDRRPAHAAIEAVIITSHEGRRQLERLYRN